jgi:hypothetical protein
MPAHTAFPVTPDREKRFVNWTIPYSCFELCMNGTFSDVQSGQAEWAFPVSHSQGFSGHLSPCTFAENGPCRVGWNGHVTQCEMAMLLQEREMIFLKLWILLLHDYAEERIPLDESSWP